MSVTLEVSFGKASKATVTGSSIREAIKKAQVFAEIPDACPVCGLGTRLEYRVAQDYEFYEVRCEGQVSNGSLEFHVSQLGVFKDDPRELYYKQSEEWNTIRPRGKGSSPAPDYDAPQQRRNQPSGRPPEPRAKEVDKRKVAQVNEILAEGKKSGLTILDMKSYLGVDNLIKASDEQLFELAAWVAEHS